MEPLFAYLLLDTVFLVLLFRMFQPLFLILVLAFLLSLWLSHSIAKSIVLPLNRLDLDHPLENDAYEEISPLLRRIARHQKGSY